MVGIIRGASRRGWYYRGGEGQVGVVGIIGEGRGK